MTNVTNEEINKELLARLDERTQNILKDVGALSKKLDDKEFVTREEFDPIKKLVYGFVGFMLISLGGMFIAVVLKYNHLSSEYSISVGPEGVSGRPK